MNKSTLLRLLYLAPLLTALLISMAGAATDPPEKTVRVFYVHPNDVPLDSAYPIGIGKLMVSCQKWYLQKCGFTFRINNPVCEVVQGSHPRSWYENTPNPAGSTDRYWFSVFNGWDDLLKLVPSITADRNHSKWKIVLEMDAEGPGAGGGASPGEVLLPKHDADGAKGYPKDTARWGGGMCHELGHCWGLPDANGDDGTIMSAALYAWPNCTFPANLVNTIKNFSANSGFWVTEITETANYAMAGPVNLQKWVPVIRGDRIQVPLSATSVFGASIGIYDLSGRRAAYFSPTAAESAGSLPTFDVGDLKNGNYICSFEKNGKILQTTIVKKIH
ncbi:MAG: T9SS type A sorting domain-containing protein [Chitinispirillaceae bacterium]|nr:T9SS type A sorting domain-containing protein [Chitinispirillaceae bacterium]